MKCPLLTMTSYLRPEVKLVSGVDCLKEECAWWDKKLGYCGYLSIDVHLRELVNTLARILVKMPQNERTRERM